MQGEVTPIMGQLCPVVVERWTAREAQRALRDNHSRWGGVKGRVLMLI